MKILTNHWGQKASPTWRSVSTYVPPQGNGLIPSLRLAIKLYSKRLEFDCVVLGAGRSDLFFALLQSVLPFRRVPCIILDCLWNKSPNRFRHFANRLCRTLASKSVDRFVVWARHEVDSFSATFGIPREKFVFVPYHTTIRTEGLKSTNGGYVFSGGNSDRDYLKLIEAARELPVRVVIATTLSISAGSTLTPNVDIRGYPSDEFMQALASCAINVVALAPGTLRSAGQQTFLNSMLLGKPTIVTDEIGAADYIDNGEDGLLVPPNDPVALREAILLLLNDPQKAAAMGERAKRKAALHSIDEHFKKIVAVAHRVVAEQRPRLNASGASAIADSVQPRN